MLEQEIQKLNATLEKLILVLEKQHDDVLIEPIKKPIPKTESYCEETTHEVTAKPQGYTLEEFEEKITEIYESKIDVPNIAEKIEEILAKYGAELLSEVPEDKREIVVKEIEGLV